ncbi:MAG: hypothetical protein CL764_03365 [Chloroflexi bacterium]|nr:hypothetical protein [Chloroflexota bacterium]
MEKYLIWIIKLSISGLFLTPLLVSPETIYPFTVGKAIWFRSLIIVSTTAFLILVIKYGEERPKIPSIILLLFAFLIINLISSFLGNSFTKSFWGTWLRMEGIITIIYIILMIFVTVNFFKFLDEWKNLFIINFFIGCCVTLIALSQFIGIPFSFLNFLPITITYLPLNESYPGFGDTVINAKVNGTLANPNFLAQYLSITVIIGLGLLIEKSNFIIKNFKTNKDFIKNSKIELLKFSLITLGISASLFTIILSGSRGALLGLFAAILVTIPFLIIKINNKYLKYTFISLFFSSLIITFSSILYLTFAIDWSIDKYRNRILEENLPKSILEKITLEKTDNSFFNKEKFYKYGMLDFGTKIKTPFVDQDPNANYDFYRPLLKTTIENLIFDVDKLEENNFECNEKLLALNEIIIWENSDNPDFFGYLTSEQYYELPSGKKITLAGSLSTGGDYTKCNSIYKILYKIHPSISYMIKGGIDLNNRKITYRMALEAFKEKPILGFGTENFSYIFYKYLRGTDFDGYSPSKWDRTHSRPLDILTSTGVLGFTIWSLIWLWIIYAIIKNFKDNHQNTFYIFIAGALTSFFVNNLLVFPTISTYIQYSLLISFLARSQIGFHENSNIQYDSEKDIEFKNFLVTSVFSISLISFYFLIINPFSASHNQIPKGENNDLEIYSNKLSSFPEMSILGRTNLVYQILIDWDSILSSAKSKEEKQEIIAKIVSVIESNAKDSLDKDPNDFDMNLAMWNFYTRIYLYDQSYINKIEEKSKKLIELSPTNLSSQETMIKTSVLKKDLDSAKKWNKIWIEDHPNLHTLDKYHWDSLIASLENELQN